jgi:hypothetical protein
MGDDHWEIHALAWLQDTLRPLGKRLRFESLPTADLVADGTTKWRILDSRGTPLACAIASAASAGQSHLPVLLSLLESELPK